MPTKRCGCASDSCSCVITGGDGVEVSGGGTKTNPYVLDATPAVPNLDVQDENTVVRSGVSLIDFQGPGVNVAAGDAGEVIVTVPGIPAGGMTGITAQVQVFTAAGPNTWTKPANCLLAVVEVVAGGGGSGGTTATTASDNAASGAGGGGGYSRKVVLNADLGATEVATVGGGGTAGAATPTAGGAGGTSSFGSHCSANGGSGGAVGTATASGNNAYAGGAGGGASAGNVNIPGAPGRSGQVVTGQRMLIADGGDSQFGRGGVVGNNTVGTNGQNYGSGGGGSTSAASQAARTGAPGGNGIVVVTTYIKT